MTRERGERRTRFNLTPPEPDCEPERVEVVTIAVHRDDASRTVFTAMAADWVSVLDPAHALGVLEDAAKALADMVAREQAELGPPTGTLHTLDADQGVEEGTDQDDAGDQPAEGNDDDNAA